MKDILNRDIVVGDTLAMATQSMHTGPSLKLYKVIDSAPFALQLKNENDEHNIVLPDASQFVICDWAR